MRLTLLITGVVCAVATRSLAEEFDRPIPQAQSATAEFWFAMGSLALIAALWLAHRLVSRS